MNLSTAIGHTIRTLRTEQQLKMRQMHPYVSISHISGIERGVKNASPDLLELLAEGVHITTPDLLRKIANTMEEYK